MVRFDSIEYETQAGYWSNWTRWQDDRSVLKRKFYVVMFILGKKVDGAVGIR